MTPSIPRDADQDVLPWMEQWQARSECPRPDLLLPAQEGVLPEELNAAVRAHVAACPLCSELMAVLADQGSDPTVEEARRIEQRVRFRTAGAPRRWVPMAAAAAVLVVAGGLYFARVAERSSVPVVQSPAASLPAPPVRRAPVLALSAPDIMLPPESLTLRGEPRTAYAAALEDALTPFAAGNYQDAAARLVKVARDHPRRPHAEFYTGAARLLIGDAAGAVGPLRAARELTPRGSPLSDAATWYLAVALERSDRREAAGGALTDLCGGGGPRKAQACEGLRLMSNR
jgi:hypothetical protein